MADDTAAAYGAGGQPETPEEAAKPRPADYWHGQLKEYRERIENKWSDQRKNLDKLYSREDRSDSTDREYSIFWANIEVLRPAVYARPPVPVVAPRFKQANPMASAASDVLERCLVTTFEQSDIDGCMMEVRDELLRYSRGSARVRFVQGQDGIEKIAFDEVTASDFAHDPIARSWRECKWVGFRAWLNGDELEKRFGPSMTALDLDIKMVPKKKRDENSAATSKEDQAPVWEIWCKTTGMVHFVAEDFDYELDTQQPWLNLTGFWPCPKPAFGTLVPKKLKPVPDILQYKDQIEEINEYTARIAALSQSLRVKGFYPAGAAEISEAIETAMKSIENRAILVPVSSAAALGGTSFKDAVIWLPVDQILETIKGLVDLRRTLIDDVYQITGLSDIVRGDTEASETATAQQIKSQWGSARIRERQRELVRFARDLTRIAGEIIAENFSPQSITAMAQVNLPTNAQKSQAQVAMKQQQEAMAQQGGGMQPGAPQPPPVPPEVQQMLQKPSVEEVFQFLRDDKARGFTVEIETDSTIQPDEDAEKQRRTEFVTAIGTLLKEAGPMVMQAPPLGEFVGEVLKFTAQGFRAGRSLEGAIDKLVEQLKAAASQPQQPQPDPKAEAEKARAAADVEKTKLESQANQQKHGMDMERMAAEQQMGQQELANEQVRLNMDQQRLAMQQVIPPQGKPN